MDRTTGKKVDYWDTAILILHTRDYTQGYPAVASMITIIIIIIND